MMRECVCERERERVGEWERSTVADDGKWSESESRGRMRGQSQLGKPARDNRDREREGQ